MLSTFSLCSAAHITSLQAPRSPAGSSHYFPEALSALPGLFYYCDKFMTESSFCRRVFIWLRIHQSGKPRQELEAGLGQGLQNTVYRAHWLACRGSQSLLSYTAWSHLPRVAPLTVVRAPPIQIINQETDPLLLREILSNRAGTFLC